MSDHPGSDPPSPFISDWVHRLRSAGRGRALDVAMGRGRHARFMAAAGFRTFGVDHDLESVAAAIRAGAAAGVTIRGWCADLTAHPLPREWFDLIVVVRYLDRDLWPALAGALAPGGVLLYETFTEAQRAKGRGPTSPHHLLKPGELREQFPSLEIEYYEETLEPDALARLAARRQTKAIEKAVYVPSATSVTCAPSGVRTHPAEAQRCPARRHANRRRDSRNRR